MKERVMVLALFLVMFSAQAQISNVVYIDASSDSARYYRDQWQESLKMTLGELDEFRTLVFLSNEKSPSISTPDEYVNIVKDLGEIRPELPLADDDLRFIVEALDNYEISDNTKLIIYTSNEALRLDLGRLLFERICLLLMESSEKIELNYYLHKSDISRDYIPTILLDIEQNTTYF
jgi:hypothetical protein